MNERENQILMYGGAEKIPYAARELVRKIRHLEQCLDKAVNYSVLRKTLNEISECKRKLQEELNKAISLIFIYNFL